MNAGVEPGRLRPVRLLPRRSFFGYRCRQKEGDGRRKAFSLRLCWMVSEREAGTSMRKIFVLAGLVAALLMAVEASAVVADPGADVAISIVADSHHAFAGQTVTATITVTNVGDATATNVVVAQFAPDNMNFVSSTCSSGSCPDSLTAGATETFALVMTAFPCGLPTRKATVGASVSADNDTNTTNNFATVTLTLSKCKP